ncbi:proton-conducting transporter membrane subunit [Kutzneria buriramensis]|uniref:Hydrogenase-4 component F n=1 Tax=Kutzneria buriramensis TaxID=1045776 RepID=A0A3E0HI40_9PSEU|nr:proton-conducting transporter membrane subunit [Kutzneria buriramensis]REH46078.1 hydrogenase-4 component F [Kutzneria buriramensis]
MITLLMLAPVGLPVLGALAYLLFGWRPATAWIAAGAAAGELAAAIGLAAVVDLSGPQIAVGGLARVDALSVFMLLVIGTVGLLATAASPSYLAAEIRAGRASMRTAARHSLLVQAFLAAMASAVLAADLGGLWIAIEATTIVTAFLVGQRRTRAAVEAAWKYVVICSTGIALALLGALLLNYAAQHTPVRPGLNLVGLIAAAHTLDPAVTKIAVAMLVIGFGTKAGLAPLHAWLPDAHSQAPAPVSALMSGVLLSVAFYAILRVKLVADAVLGAGFARALLLVMALASLALAASLLIAQRDYKRMLAYSSIEHLALIATGAAVGGPLAMAAVLLHMLGHGLAKGVLFLGAGQLSQTDGTSRIAQIRAVAARQPVLAGCLGFGVLALIGLPPFSIFASELGIARAGFAAGLGWFTAIALSLTAVAGAVLVIHVSRMLLGTPAEGPGAATASPRLPAAAGAVLLAGLTLSAALGVTAGPLTGLLHSAAVIAVGTP